MTQFIDRRRNAGKKSTVNRARFIRRYKEQIKKAVSEATGKRKITEIAKGEKISIPAKDLSEHQFRHGRGGKVDQILPGNDSFTRGDHISRPEEGGGQGKDSQASNTGEGEDEFVFQLSREEFLDIYFEDLELPDLVKKDLAKVVNFQTVRTGITTSGNPTNINVLRSMKQATGRRIALGSSLKKMLKSAEDKLKQLEEKPESEAEKENIRRTIARLQTRINKVPFIDTFDLRYNNRVRLPKPTTQAVMFCLMDVSGSMDEAKKDIAKRFFILLYLFLTRNYQKIDLVFIRHHTSAKEVDEHEFFYSRETGGTVVSSALELLIEVMHKRYPPASWNIYVAQASDGDNWNADSPICMELLRDKIMPMVQYFSYIEIMPRHHQSLWEVYKKIQDQFKHFAMEPIEKLADIYPVFRELFKRKIR